MHIRHDAIPLGRRAFLKQGSLIALAANFHMATADDLFARDADTPSVRVGLVTDLHHADKPPGGTRFYRETAGKLAEAARQFEKDKPSLIVELGDLIDAAESVEVELSYLETINRQFSQIADHRHYVLGNHCVDTLTKQEFLAAVGQKQSYYAFDSGGIHFVVLDSCFRSDGKSYGRKNSQWTDANVPREELEWLAADLKGTSHKVVVFAHQRLDVTDNHSVKNAAEVRAALQDCGKVMAVLQGHSHQNDYQEIAGIHYCTLAAMIEGSGADNNAYSIVDVHPDGSLRIRGFRRQKNHAWPSEG